LGLRAPKLGRAYAVESVQVNYELRGVNHAMIIDQSRSPDVICASSSHSEQIPSWCSQEIRAASTMATFAATTHTSSELSSAEALMVAQFALSEVQSAGHGTPTLADVRRWAAQFFPTKGANAIISVLAINNVDRPEWRFVVRDASSHATTVVCTDRGVVDSGGGMMGIGVETCPSKR